VRTPKIIVSRQENRTCDEIHFTLRLVEILAACCVTL
jgi:hypothetical protein